LIARAAPLVLALVAALTYALTAGAISQTRSLWLDEALAVWAARLPSYSDVVTAIWNGAEFSPPTYDLLLHTLFQATGSDALTARLPSIIAVLLTAALIGIMVGKRLGPLFGALAFALTLNSALFEFAIQARAYALMTTLLAGALFLWIDAGQRLSPLRATGIALCLFASASLHYYAVVTFAVFALLEGLWTLAHRKLRIGMWLALAAGALPCAVWLPLIRRHASFNSGDVNAPDFYGAPTASKLIEHVQALFLGTTDNWLFVLAAVLILAGALVYARVSGEGDTADAESRDGQRDLAIAGAGLLAALPIAFVLALTVTHAFSARYALAASIGVVILFTLAIHRAPYRTQIAYALLALLCIMPLVRSLPPDFARSSKQLLAKHPTTGPLVVGDADLFIELLESADPVVRARIVYLRRPAGVSDGNTASENQILRLKASYKPDLPIVAFDTFTRENREFTVLARPGWRNDALSDYFIAKGWVAGVYSIAPRLSLLKARTPQ